MRRIFLGNCIQRWILYRAEGGDTGARRIAAARAQGHVDHARHLRARASFDATRRRRPNRGPAPPINLGGVPLSAFGSNLSRCGTSLNHLLPFLLWNTRHCDCFVGLSWLYTPASSAVLWRSATRHLLHTRAEGDSENLDSSPRTKKPIAPATRLVDCNN